MTKHFACAFALLFCTAAFAEGPSCNAAAAEKKLAGAAKTSFLKKCEKDATATCELASKEKKLAGAAKNSFEKKCVKDAVG
jgi:psiF repeat